MKKAMSLCLILVLSFAVFCCGCGSSKEDVESTITQQSQQDKTSESSEVSLVSDITSEEETEVCEHVFSDATCTQPETCTLCLLEQGDALGHKFSAATCTQPQICDICKNTQGEPEGHSYAAATCKQPQTCTKCGESQGSTGNHTYVAGECTVCADYNELYCAKLYFTGDMSNMNSKKDVREITFEYRSKDQSASGTAKIKPQGTSSLGYAKKNYTINLYSDEERTQEYNINVGWGDQSKYCLKANWIDKTHSRNVVTAKIVGQIQEKYGLLTSAPNNGAVDGFPVEIYINGQFHGLYTMNIPKDAWMFNMDEDNPNHIVLCGENWSSAVLFQTEPNLTDWSVEVGPENEETLNKFKRVSDFVRNSTDEDFKSNFAQYINLDAALNYYIMMHYGWMPDNLGKNMLMATYDGQVWYPCLYDLDTTWGTDWKGLSVYDYENIKMETATNILWTRFEQIFSKEIAERYFELREGILDTENVKNEFKQFYDSIPAEIFDREVAKWGQNIPGYDLEQIYKYLDTFIPILDERMNAWRQSADV